MTQTLPFEMTEYDIDFLTDTWKGVKGAAYNTVYEDLKEAGLVTSEGKPTPKGYKAIQEYEMKSWNL